MNDILKPVDDLINKLIADNAGLASKPQVNLAAQRLIGAAFVYANRLKVPYGFGKEYVPDKQMDCSSFLQEIYEIALGHKLPRTSRDQAKQGVGVTLATIEPGDLIFYDFNHDGAISHVSMYIGGGEMIHTNGGDIKYPHVRPVTWNGNGIVAVRRII